MTAAYLVRGDARRLPLATGSVQCVVTSPPYFGLRSYGGQTSVWGGDPECPHKLSDSPAVKPMTGGTGAASGKQTSNKGSQFGNAWADVHPPGYRSSDTNPGPLQGPGNTNRERIGSALCTRCGAWSGELGSEPTPALFVEHIIQVFREVKRVLRDDGICFLNIGDSYNSGTNAVRGPSKLVDVGHWQKDPPASHRTKANNVRVKSLLLVPERLAIALSDDGWIVRSRIAWCKAAPMPESVDDRPTSAWEHIWQLTKSNKALFWTHRAGPGTRTQPAPDYRWRKDGVELTEEPEDAKEQGWKRVNLWRGHDYYWDQEATKQPLQESSLERGYTYVGQPETSQKMLAAGDDVRSKANWRENGYVPTGANMRNFWLLGPDPYSGAHFATYPRELVRRCVAAATSEYGACAACGAPYRRLTTRATIGGQPKYAQRSGVLVPGNTSQFRSDHDVRSEVGVNVTTTGWAPACRCGPSAGVRPCIVADPFSGSGTTAYVAASMGRIGVGVELSAEYTEQARYGRLAQDFLPLGVEAGQDPTTKDFLVVAPTRAAERQVGLFESEVAG